MNKFIFLLLLCLSSNKSEEVKKVKYKKKVCVIGAGPSGITATQRLATNLDEFDIVTFEKAHNIGGQWLYSDETDNNYNENPVHYSSVYKNMRLNTPLEVNNFPDWPVIEGAVNESFVHHRFMLQYLLNYTNHYNLKQYIQFDTLVLNVSLINRLRNRIKIIDNQEYWNVTVKNLKTNEIQNHIFDAVIICNGHFSKPKVPKIPGLEDFKGQVLHSHSYRDPEMFRNKTVIVVGAGSSGFDIGQEILEVTTKVYLSHNNPYKMPVSDFVQISRVYKFENGVFVLKDNTILSADVVLFCTGYEYWYPFLDNSTEIVVDNNYVTPLYKRMFNVEHPSMSFIALPNGYYSQLPFSWIQAHYIVANLEGKVKLPSKSEMLEESKLYRAKTPKNSDFLNLDQVWRYLDDLSSSDAIPSIPEHYKKVTNLILATFKERKGAKDFNVVISPDKKSLKIVPYCKSQKNLIT